MLITSVEYKARKQERTWTMFGENVTICKIKVLLPVNLSLSKEMVQLFEWRNPERNIFDFLNLYGIEILIKL